VTGSEAVASGYSGSLLGFVSIPFCTGNVVRTRLGRAAYAYHPYLSATNDECANERYLDPDQEYDPPDEKSETLIQRYNKKDKCSLCGRKDEDGPFHLFCECVDEVLYSAREALRSSMFQMLRQLAAKIKEMPLLDGERRASNITDYVESAGERPLSPTQKMRAKALRRIDRLLLEFNNSEDSLDLNEADINFVTYHMLTVMTFSSKLPRYLRKQTVSPTTQDGPLPQLPLALRLGRVFDATVLANDRIRPIANLMAKWASRWISHFA
jgi:hypothetical protein